MTELFLRLFVPEIKNGMSTKVRSAVGKLSGAVGIVSNLLLFALKLAIGLMCGSVAVVADSMNNLTDASSSLVTLWGFRMAQQPADKDHPYGHARYEYISGLAVAVIILVIGVELLKSSVAKILSPADPEYSIYAYAILAGTVLVKLWLCFFYKRTGKLIDSATLMAASVDSRNDVIATSVVIAGGILHQKLGISIDGYIGAAVALFIIYSGFCTAKDTISPLLGKQADTEVCRRITQMVMSQPGILGVHDLLIHDYGPGRYFATLHAEMDANESLVTCHETIDCIEREVHDSTGVHLVVHIDPVETDDGERNTMKAVLEKIVHDIDPSYSFHDFRIVRGAERTKLVFELGVPYSMHSRRDEIKKKIDTELDCGGYNYTTVIRFDRI